MLLSFPAASWNTGSSKWAYGRLLMFKFWLSEDQVMFRATFPIYF